MGVPEITVKCYNNILYNSGKLYDGYLFYQILVKSRVLDVSWYSDETLQCLLVPNL